MAAWAQDPPKRSTNTRPPPAPQAASRARTRSSMASRDSPSLESVSTPSTGPTIEAAARTRASPRGPWVTMSAGTIGVTGTRPSFSVLAHPGAGRALALHHLEHVQVQALRRMEAVDLGEVVQRHHLGDHRDVLPGQD